MNTTVRNIVLTPVILLRLVTVLPLKLVVFALVKIVNLLDKTLPWYVSSAEAQKAANDQAFEAYKAKFTNQVKKV